MYGSAKTPPFLTFPPKGKGFSLPLGGRVREGAKTHVVQPEIAIIYSVNSRKKSRTACSYAARSVFQART